MRTGFLIFLLIGSALLLAACSGEHYQEESAAPTVQTATAASTVSKETSQPATSTQASEETTALQNEEIQEQKNDITEYPDNQPAALQMAIGDTPVSVAWEDNDAVQALKELCKDQPLTIHTSMYGGFEQVGSIGTNLPQNDVQTTTSAGDIVLYSGNQLVVFYGSNTWAYTCLGHIIDQSPDDLANLLSNGDTTVTISLA